MASTNVPFLPWTRAMYEYVQKTQNAYDPEVLACRAHGAGPPARFRHRRYPTQFLQPEEPHRG